MTVSYYIFNSINHEPILSVIMPVDYKLAMKGFYSGLWKDLKTGCASVKKIDKRFVRADVTFNAKQKTDRMVIAFPSGMKMDAPFDLTRVDHKIINLHLEALALSKGIKVKGITKNKRTYEF